MSELLNRVVEERYDAEVKAWKALAGYKFFMFGYWAAAWVKYNQLLPKHMKDGNPWKDLVAVGQQDVDARALAAAHREEGQNG